MNDDKILTEYLTIVSKAFAENKVIRIHHKDGFRLLEIDGEEKIRIPLNFFLQRWNVDRDDPEHDEALKFSKTLIDALESSGAVDMTVENGSRILRSVSGELLATMSHARALRYTSSVLRNPPEPEKTW